MAASLRTACCARGHKSKCFLSRDTPMTWYCTPAFPWKRLPFCRSRFPSASSAQRSRSCSPCLAEDRRRASELDRLLLQFRHYCRRLQPVLHRQPSPHHDVENGNNEQVEEGGDNHAAEDCDANGVAPYGTSAAGQHQRQHSQNERD